MVVLAVSALALPALAVLEDDFASGELSAGRNVTLVCTAVNKSGAPADLQATLKQPNGNVLLANACDSVPNGQSCAVSFKHLSAIPLVAYCHVLAPAGAVVTGNLRLDNQVNVSDASSDLRPLAQNGGLELSEDSTYTVTETKGPANEGEAVANNKFVDASCDAGDLLLSGGIRLFGTTGGGAVTSAPNQELADHLTVLENRPLSEDTWRVRAHETPDNGLTNAQGWAIQARIICLDLTS